MLQVNCIGRVVPTVFCIPCISAAKISLTCCGSLSLANLSILQVICITYCYCTWCNSTAKKKPVLRNMSWVLKIDSLGPTKL